jgi:tetratricopeptide (TPR) repeat protein
MQTAVRPSDLQELAKFLQERLQAELVGEVRLQVRCMLQNDILLVLAQHPQSIAPEAPPIFRVLQQTIQEVQPEFTEKVRLYLRAVGQKQPRAVRDFIIEKSTVSLNRTDLEEEDDDFDDLFRWLGKASSETEETREENNINASFYSQEIANQESNISTLVNNVATESETESDSMADLALEEPPSQSSLPETEAIYEQPVFPKKQHLKTEEFSLSPKLLITVAVVTVVAFLSSLYAFSRPCVIGSCPQIKTAKQLGQESTQTIKKAKTIRDVEKAQQKLTTATQLLGSIPFWSNYHGEAQKLLPNYQTQANFIDPVLMAMKKADEAAEKSQNPPHSAEQWQDINSLWKQSVALLKQVPKTSPVYPLAQEKLLNYRDNSVEINQRINLEETTKNRIVAAKQTAQTAELRQVSARSLENWQEIESIWQKAIATLASIPKTVTGYEEAQQLLDSYQTKLATVRDRRNQERISANIYNQSLTLASLAQNQEQRNQWSEAVSSWRRALTYAQQVPKGTFYHPQAQPLIDSYTSALNQAQDRLKIALVLQKANTDLNRVCNVSPKICDHIVTRQGIKVYLTPTYVNSVRRTAMSAGINGDANTLAGVDDHLKTLQSALEAISENSVLPLEIYDHTRLLIGKYNPKPS